MALFNLCGNKYVYTFPMRICPKVNLTTWQDFKLTDLYTLVQNFSHHTTRTSPHIFANTRFLESSSRAD